MAGVLQNEMQLVDNRVGFTSLDDLRGAGVDLEKPPYVCYLPEGVMFTVLNTNLGIRIASCACLECANKRECPVCALSFAARTVLRPLFLKLINMRDSEAQGSIPLFVALLNAQTGLQLLPEQDKKLILPDLAIQFNFASDPSFSNMEFESLPQI